MPRRAETAFAGLRLAFRAAALRVPVVTSPSPAMARYQAFLRDALDAGLVATWGKDQGIDPSRLSLMPGSAGDLSELATRHGLLLRSDDRMTAVVIAPEAPDRDLVRVIAWFWPARDILGFLAGILLDWEDEVPADVLSEVTELRGGPPARPSLRDVVSGAGPGVAPSMARYDVAAVLSRTAMPTFVNAPFGQPVTVDDPVTSMWAALAADDFDVALVEPQQRIGARQSTVKAAMYLLERLDLLDTARALDGPQVQVARPSAADRGLAR